MSLEFWLTDWERAETHWLLSYLNQYLNTMETSLLETAQLAHSTLSATREEYDDEVEWDQRWHEHCRLFEDEFPTKLRYSFLTLFYSYIETRTRSFCSQLFTRHLTNVLFNPSVKGHKSYLVEVKKYFSLYQLLATAASTLWQPLLDLARLRNCIVHQNGIVADAKDRIELAAIIKRTNGVSGGDDGEIRVELEYCKKLITVTTQFFETCFDAAGFCPKYDHFRRVADA